MAWSQVDIDALEDAIASGIKEVHYAGPPARKVVYQDTSQMLKALAHAKHEVQDTPAYRLVKWSKGFRS